MGGIAKIGLRLRPSVHWGDTWGRTDQSGEPVERTGRTWHVTVTVAGSPIAPSLVRAALQRLAGEQPFLSSIRYAPHRAELSYWEQAEDMIDAASMALRIWNEHRTTSRLPSWEVVGLEVLEQETYRVRSPDSGSMLATAQRPLVLPF
jgi:hypothetical protein